MPDHSATEYEGGFLERLDPAAYYKICLAYTLPDDLSAEILRIRTKLLPHLADGVQLTPHLVLLFFGERTGRALERIAGIAHSLSTRPIEFGVRGLASFVRGNAVTNIHLRVTEDANVVAAHAEASREAVDAGERSDTRFHGAAYVPHISVFDHIQGYRGPLPVEQLPMHTFTWQGLAGPLRLFGRRLIAAGAD